MESETKICRNCKKDFIIEPEDFDFYKKIDVPPPTFCPECRLQRRLAWRNERGLYRQKCAKCETSIISVFPKNSGLTVYCRPCWWSDSWDGLDYGVNFDPSKPFIFQLVELFRRVPAMCLFGVYHTLQNSDYVNMASELKNCYLLYHSDQSENCSYGSMISGSRDSVDNLLLNESELCYETINCQKCYRTFYSIDCEGCTDVWFSRNCVGCTDCVGCANLRNKSNYIFNEPYSPESYKAKLRELDFSAGNNITRFQSKARDFWLHFPQKYTHVRHAANVSGDYIYNCKNTKNSFVAYDMEDSKFCCLVTPGGTTNAYDFTHYGMSGTDLMYETLQCGNQSSRIRFSWFTLTGSQNVEYGMFGIGCRDCFGIVGLKKRQYCILNKQYSKEEYEKLRGIILKQMHDNPYVDAIGNEYRYGEFYPIELSPFGYNATTTQESFPLNQAEVSVMGYSYKSPEYMDYKVTITSDNLPETIAEVPDSFLNEIIECSHKGKCSGQCVSAFRITPSELQFHRRMNLPLPQLCPNCRFDERLVWRNPFRLWHRQCMCDKTTHRHSGKCLNEFETSYAPDRPEIVYCENCYNSEVA